MAAEGRLATRLTQNLENLMVTRVGAVAALVLVLCPQIGWASELCTSETQISGIQFKLEATEERRIGQFTVVEGHFLLRNSPSSEVAFHILGDEGLLRPYPLSVGFQLQAGDNEWMDTANSLESMMAPDTLVELSESATVRFVQDMSGTYWPDSDAKPRRAWIKDERSGCRIYSEPFELPKR